MPSVGIREPGQSSAVNSGYTVLYKTHIFEEPEATRTLPSSAPGHNDTYMTLMDWTRTFQTISIQLKQVLSSIIENLQRISPFHSKMAPAALISPIEAPVPVAPATKKATRPANQIPQSMVDDARTVKRESFDPNKHLNCAAPSRIYTMKEIGLEGHGISPNAASEPFPLFTEEAIRQMRAEIFSEEVMRDCQYTSTFIKNMVRGMGPA